MPRSYVRKSTRVSYGTGVLQNALKEIQSGKSLRAVSRIYNIPCRALRHHRDNKVKRPGVLMLCRFRQDINEEYETFLVGKIQEMEKAFFGLKAVMFAFLQMILPKKLNYLIDFQEKRKELGKINL